METTTPIPLLYSAVKKVVNGKNEALVRKKYRSDILIFLHITQHSMRVVIIAMPVVIDKSPEAIGNSGLLICRLKTSKKKKVTS